MRAFGSWTKACEAAGVETARDGARRLRAERDLEAARAYDVRQRAERAAREARRESEAENRRVQPGHESVSARRGRERNEERAARVREQIQNGEVRVTWASDTQIEAWRREKEAGRRARYELSDAELGIVPGAISEPDDAVADVEDISDEEIDDLEDVAA
jgi:rRNA maturation endonuclease Nob1